MLNTCVEFEEIKEKDKAWIRFIGTKEKVIW